MPLSQYHHPNGPFSKKLHIISPVISIDRSDIHTSPSSFELFPRQHGSARPPVVPTTHHGNVKREKSRTGTTRTGCISPRIACGRFAWIAAVPVQYSTVQNPPRFDLETRRLLGRVVPVRTRKFLLVQPNVASQSRDPQWWITLI
jgi:hypothetical protein